MPQLKTRAIFISHAWKYNEHYWKVVNWFKEGADFEWKNYSVPDHDPLSRYYKKEVRRATNKTD